MVDADGFIACFKLVAQVQFFQKDPKRSCPLNQTSSKAPSTKTPAPSAPVVLHRWPRRRSKAGNPCNPLRWDLRPEQITRSPGAATETCHDLNNPSYQYIYILYICISIYRWDHPLNLADAHTSCGFHLRVCGKLG